MPPPATINRELALLKRAFNLGKEQTPAKVRAVPYFLMLDERDNVRTGFLDDSQYAVLSAACGEHCLGLRGQFETAYAFGFRRGELLPLLVRQIDFAAGMIRLEPGTTKNGEGRNIPMTSTVRNILSLLCHGKKSDDFVFTWKDGSQIHDIRVPWEKACKKAGVPELLFHDLRRSAARNMRRCGIAEDTIMAVMGHNTRSMLTRYSIVNEADLRDEIRKLETKITIESQLGQSSNAEAKQVQ